MSEQRPPRVRVTGPPRRAVTRRTRTVDIDEETPLGGVYLGSLLRAQLGLAVRVLLALAVTVGGLPLAFAVAPGLAGVEVAGIGLAWLLVGVVVYPWLLVLGLVYVRRAEQHERDFTALLTETTTEDDPGEPTVSSR